MNWFWLNIPLMAIFFLAITGIPLWLVLRHPDTGPVPARAQAQRRPELPDNGQVPVPVRVPSPQAEPARYAAARDLAGARR